MSNWRKVLSWANEDQIHDEQRQYSWEDEGAPFDLNKAEQLRDSLRHLTDNYISYSFIPNVFRERNDILRKLKNRREYVSKRIIQLDELIDFYEELNRNYPVEN